jgi:hypothetical protein
MVSLTATPIVFVPKSKPIKEWFGWIVFANAETSS